ncbi:MAG: hypothetical protein QOD86_2353 [Miltoncostaeaceae bacterium]|nr:hypothetical protein [Miltoncostaeaceae bacterium]
MSADPGRRLPPEDLGFRSLAAPGLDEDDLLAAIYGPPGSGVLWGDGRPPALGPDGLRGADDERRRRHEALLERWPPEPEPPRP